MVLVEIIMCLYVLVIFWFASCLKFYLVIVSRVVNDRLEFVIDF